MKRQEAMDLETLCEAWLKKAMGYDELMISMNLAGRLKIEINNNSIAIDRDFSRITYVNYCGDYDSLMIDCENFIKCVNEHKEKFKLLAWSYNHIDKLED